MIRTRLLFVVLSLAVASAAFATVVRGRFVEAVSGDAMVSVPYKVFAGADTVHPVVFDVSDAEGRFSTNLHPGKYRLKTEYVGKKPLSIEFTAANSATDLGDLELLEVGETLSEVTVVATKDLISSDGAKLTYDVERDPSSGTNTVMEMLRKVPMVTVDGEDNIKVKGDSNFKIYINGKPDPMLSGDPKNILKSMPASSIKKIEVITDPGAKYEAEGTAGILNIITDKKQSMEGYLVTARAGVSNGGYNGNLYGRTKINKVTASANVSGSNYSVMRAHTYTNSERENFTSDTERYYRSHSKGLQKSYFLSGNLNLSWEPDTLNLFTLSGNIGHYKSRQNASQSVTMSNIDNALVWGYKRDFFTKSSSLWSSANASYQHTFPNNTQHTLTLTAQYDYGESPYRSDVRNYDYENLGYDVISPFQGRRQTGYSNSYTLQGDYVLPLFSDKHTFETGFKAVLRRSDSNNRTLDGLKEEEVLPISASKVQQFNDVYAAYVSYNASFWKFAARAGLRYEHTRMGLDYKYQENTGDWADFTTRLNDLVPNASLTYKLTEMSNFRVAYRMRIWRPSLGYLNPYVNTLTFGSLSYGNPDLKSEHNNMVELKYSNYGGKFSGEASVSYSQTNNSIESNDFMKDNVQHSTYANIGRYRSVDLGGYLMYQITSTMDASLYVGGSYNDYNSRGAMNVRNHGWQGYFNANYGYTTPFKLRIDAWGGGGTPGIGAQEKYDTWYYYGFSLSRSFLKNDALTLSINCNQFLTPERKSTFTTTTETFREQYTNKFKQWSAGFSITYKFGGLKSDVRRTNASISNDDMKSQSSGGNGGGR